MPLFAGEDDDTSPAALPNGIPSKEEQERQIAARKAIWESAFSPPPPPPRPTLEEAINGFGAWADDKYYEGSQKYSNELADLEEAAAKEKLNAPTDDIGGKNSSIGIDNIESTEYKNTMFGSKEDFSKQAESSTNFKAISPAFSLANSQFRPKLKFMFYVDCELMPEISGAISDKWPQNIMFMAKTVDRPKMTVEYEEINQYNFKTRVAKNIKTEEVSITFYDDSSNYLIDFFRFVMSLWQPITRRSNTMNSDMSTGNIMMLDGHGMSFSDDTYNTSDYSHRGVINTVNGQIFQTIKVTQTFIVPTGENPEQQISFLYVNPMIHSIELNELSAEDSSSTSEVVLKFSYDAVITPTTEGMQVPRNPMPAFKGVAAEISVQNSSAAGKRVEPQPSNTKFPTNVSERSSSSGGFGLDLRSAVRGGLTGGLSGAVSGLTRGIGVNINGVSITPSSIFQAASAIKTLANNKNARIDAFSNVMLGNTYGPLVGSAIKGTMTKDKLVRSGFSIMVRSGFKPSISIKLPAASLLNDSTQPGGSSNGEE